MDNRVKDELLHRLVIINEERTAIVKAMEVIDACITTIKNLMQDIERNYNEIFIEIKKL